MFLPDRPFYINIYGSENLMATFYTVGRCWKRWINWTGTSGGNLSGRGLYESLLGLYNPVMTVPIKIAAFAQPGQLLPTNYPWMGQLNHVVKSVERHNDHTKITTNEGEWTFAAAELVNFPRRPDGSSVTWDVETAQEEATVQDLCANDLIKSGGGLWVISRISFAGRPEEISITASNGYVTKTFSSYFLGPIIAFYYGKAPGGPKKVSALEEVVYPLWGPYVQEDGRLVMFAQHPTGRGRWPKDLPTIKDWIEPIPGLRVMRPPKDFTKVEYIGPHAFRRHPKDPRWGDRPATEWIRASYAEELEELETKVLQYGGMKGLED